MKKMVFVMLLAGGMAMAQAPTPPRDTIYGRNPTYLYPEGWSDYYDTDFCDKGIIQTSAVPYIEIYNQAYRLSLICHCYETDTPLTIIGMATAGLIHLVERMDERVNDSNLAHWQEYMRVYQHVGDSMVLLAEKPYNILDTTRWMRPPAGERGWIWDQYLPYHELDTHYVNIPVYEVYFDNPVTVTDSFYAAITWENPCPEENGIPRSYGFTFMAEYLPTCSHNEEDFQLVKVAGQECFYFDNERNYKWGFWQYKSDYLLALFPIIDTTGMGLSPNTVPCGVVEDLQVVSMWGNNVKMEWAEGDNTIDWQIAYGHADADPEGYAVATVTTASYTMRNLDRGVMYAARVRARCHGNENYSEWSDTVQFVLAGGGAPEVIDSVADRHTYLVPNPAGESVTVVSSFELRHVSVDDMSGQQVFDKECTGHAVALDVSGWPSGIYIVVISNQQGTTVRKLSVSR